MNYYGEDFWKFLGENENFEKRQCFLCIKISFLYFKTPKVVFSIYTEYIRLLMTSILKYCCEKCRKNQNVSAWHLWLAKQFCGPTTDNWTFFFFFFPPRILMCKVLIKTSNKIFTFYDFYHLHNYVTHWQNAYIKSHTLSFWPNH